MDSNLMKSLVLTLIQPRCGCHTLPILTRGFHPGLFKFNPLRDLETIKLNCL